MDFYLELGKRKSVCRRSLIFILFRVLSVSGVTGFSQDFHKKNNTDNFKTNLYTLGFRVLGLYIMYVLHMKQPR